jgi:hypothetical protein
MNLVFLFLTRSDLDSIPRIKNWLNDMGKVDVVTAFVNPHLAIDPSEDQVKLENKIIEAMQSTLIVPEERISMELDLQKRWMQIPREIMLAQLDKIFEPFGISTKVGLTVLNESFQADRLPELLTKLRPAWPRQIPLGSFVLIFPNQIPEAKPAGRPKGKVKDPVQLAKMQANLANAREERKKKRIAAQKAAEEAAKLQPVK